MKNRQKTSFCVVYLAKKEMKWMKNWENRQKHQQFGKWNKIQIWTLPGQRWYNKNRISIFIATIFNSPTAQDHLYFFPSIRICFIAVAMCYLLTCVWTFVSLVSCSFCAFPRSFLFFNMARIMANKMLREIEENEKHERAQQDKNKK